MSSSSAVAAITTATDDMVATGLPCPSPLEILIASFALHDDGTVDRPAPESLEPAVPPPLLSACGPSGGTEASHRTRLAEGEDGVLSISRVHQLGGCVRVINKLIPDGEVSRARERRRSKCTASSSSKSSRFLKYVPSPHAAFSFARAQVDSPVFE